MFNTNLVLPLLALGLYSHHHSINLANNTSLLIIVLALALQQREITDLKDELATDTNNNVCRHTNCANNNHWQTTYSTSSNFPYAQPFPYNVNWQNGNCGNCGCGGNCPNFGYTTFN